MRVDPNVKVGDPIYLKRASMSQSAVMTVERVTPKQLVVDGQRFWRKDGWRIGWPYWTGRVWSTIVETTTTEKD